MSTEHRQHQESQMSSEHQLHPEHHMTSSSEAAAHQQESAKNRTTSVARWLPTQKCPSAAHQNSIVLLTKMATSTMSRK